MQFYSKLIAALVGLAVIIGGRYGLDLEAQQMLITDALGAIITAVGVYLAKNKPTTEAQVEKAADIVTEGREKVIEKRADGS